MELRYRLEAGLLRNSLKTFAGINYTAAQKRVAPQFGERITPDYAVVNAGCHYALSKSFDFSLSINNLFNKNYREHLTRFISAQNPLWAPCRNMVVMATLKF
jgi:outer membrane receptor protein involved in Fe transport